MNYNLRIKKNGVFYITPKEEDEQILRQQIIFPQEMYKDYSDELKHFCKMHKHFKLPDIKTIRGQILALYTATENLNRVTTRREMEEWLDKIGMHSDDIIQAINKTDQYGLKSRTINRKYYYVPYPFEYIDLHVRKRKNAKIPGNKQQQIDLIKDYYRYNIIDVPYELWTIGHRDPHSKDSSIKNLLYQAPIQQKERDRYKYDSLGRRWVPTVTEIRRMINKFYPTVDEKKYLVQLGKDIEKELISEQKIKKLKAKNKQIK